MPHDTLGELLSGIVGRVLAHHAPQQIPAARDGVADRECERLAEAVVIHGAGVPILFSGHGDRPAPAGLSRALAIGYNVRMTIRLAALALVLLASPALACERGTLTGYITYVRDGDTLEFGDMAIRLQGLAAPEWNEPNGKAARDAMIELVHGRVLRCESRRDAHL